MYTDGLIERRGTSLRYELDRLRSLIAESPPGAEECLDWLEETLSADSVPDDIAMLAMATPSHD